MLNKGGQLPNFARVLCRCSNSPCISSPISQAHGGLQDNHLPPSAGWLVPEGTQILFSKNQKLCILTCPLDGSLKDWLKCFPVFDCLVSSQADVTSWKVFIKST